MASGFGHSGDFEKCIKLLRNLTSRRRAHAEEGVPGEGRPRALPAVSEERLGVPSTGVASLAGERTRPAPNFLQRCAPGGEFPDAEGRQPEAFGPPRASGGLPAAETCRRLPRFHFPAWLPASHGLSPPRWPGATLRPGPGLTRRRGRAETGALPGPASDGPRGCRRESPRGRPASAPAGSPE